MDSKGKKLLFRVPWTASDGGTPPLCSMRAAAAVRSGDHCGTLTLRFTAAGSLFTAMSPSLRSSAHIGPDNLVKNGI